MNQRGIFIKTVFFNGHIVFLQTVTGFLIASC